MKIYQIVFIITMLFFYSCKKEASRDQPYKDALIGSWHISQWTNPYDTTISYVGYNLIFTADGKIQGTDLNSVSSNGTWYEYSYEGIPQFYVRTEMERAEFYLLNGMTWTFLTYSSSRIDFEIRSYGALYTMTLLKN